MTNFILTGPNLNERFDSMEAAVLHLEGYVDLDLEEAWRVEKYKQDDERQSKETLRDNICKKYQIRCYV